MNTASVAEMKSHFAQYVKASATEPVFVTLKGKRIAVLLGGQDEADLERLAMSYSPKLREILDRSYAQAKAGDVIAHEDFWAEATKMEGRSISRKRTKPRKKN
jgi:prevent-host-death family protein